MDKPTNDKGAGSALSADDAMFGVGFGGLGDLDAPVLNLKPAPSLTATPIVPDLAGPAVAAAPPTVSDAAFARVAAISAAQGAPKMLRVAVLGGGCSGFQYEFALADAPEDDDVLFEKDGATVLVDEASLPFLGNAVIDFKNELIGARFVIENPNATSSCGCGTSFAM